MNSFLIFISDKFPILLEKLLQQIYLSVGAVLISIALSVPLGLFIARRTKICNAVLSLAGILQTIPSLAILGLLLPFFGIGIKTAIIALVLYTMLPIIRNTVVGLLSVPADLLEAANGLGLTKFQKMHLIELPLAFPVVMGGIRTAMTMSVGIATLAAFIGAGGLGDFIYQGLSLNNMNLILLGAIPTAMLALGLDYFIAKIEKTISVRRKIFHRKRNFIKKSIAGLFLIALAFFICFAVYRSSENKVIVVGSKNSSEQLILGELMAQLLERKSFHVIRKFNLGGTYLSHQALVSGAIDVYPEYTGTGYAVILKQTQLSDPWQVYNFVSNAYHKNFALQWLKIFGFNDSNALAVRQSFAIQRQLHTIGDLVKIAPTLNIGVPADFMGRADGYLGLKDKYKLQFRTVRLMDPGLMYKAIQLQELDVIMAFSTDGRLSVYHLSLLEDNKHLFPPYFAAPVVRLAILKKYPEIEPTLNFLAGKISDQVIRNLNYQVDVLKRDPHEVARDFLRSLKN